MKVKNAKASTRMTQRQRIITDKVIKNPCKSVLIRVIRVPLLLDCEQ
jgi:hypothetical protein